MGRLGGEDVGDLGLLRTQPERDELVAVVEHRAVAEEVPRREPNVRRPGNRGAESNELVVREVDWQELADARDDRLSHTLARPA